MNGDETMSNKQNNGGFMENMTPKQKQAAIVCAVCALAIVITASVTGVVVSGRIRAADAGSQSALGDGYNADAYVIDPSNTAVLAETADAGDEYLKDTLFLGDSNTVRFYQNGLLTLQQYCAQEGLTIQKALSEKFVTFKNDSNEYTLAEAAAMMKPRRVVITLGTNNGDGSMSAADFAAQYQSLVSAIQSSYPYTDIIVNAVPPIPASHSNYPAMSQETLDQFNMALADMCQQMGVKFLNSAEALKDSTGYGNSDYFVSNDIHMTKAGLKAILSYVTTHAYQTEDRRPNTSDIPTRSESFTSGQSSTPTPTATAEVNFTAKYQVDSSGGGTLTSGDEKGKKSLSFEITDADTEITVKAVPDEGLTFIKWSDGVTTATRTDKKFKQNVNVTAIFAKVGIKISGPSTAKAGEDYTLTASLTNSKYGDLTKVVWYIKVGDGEYKKQGIPGETYTFKVEEGKAYSLYAVLIYNDTELRSNVVSLDPPAATPTPTPTPTATPTATPAPTQEPTPTPPAEESPAPPSSPDPGAETGDGTGGDTAAP